MLIIVCQQRPGLIPTFSHGAVDGSADGQGARGADPSGAQGTARRAREYAGSLWPDSPWTRAARCNLWTWVARSEEHTSELQSLMRISYAVFCLKKKNINIKKSTNEATYEQTKHKKT